MRRLAIYDPTASADAHFAFKFRLGTGVPLGVCFAVQLTHTIFIKTRHHYSLHALLTQPFHLLVLLMRVALIIGCGAISVTPLEPHLVLLCLAGLAIGQCALLQLHDFKFQIRSQNSHPMTQLPNALLALQQRRKRAADVAVNLKKAMEKTTPESTPKDVRAPLGAAKVIPAAAPSEAAGLVQV